MPGQREKDRKAALAEIRERLRERALELIEVKEGADLVIYCTSAGYGFDSHTASMGIGC